MADSVNMRLGKQHVDRLRLAVNQHPLRPTLRAAIERGIEMIINEWEKEKQDGK
jgi:hypothetical protein